MAGKDTDRMALLDRLAEEFAERYRRGERPSLGEYTSRHPQLADDIRELFPALVEIEQAEEHRQESAKPAPESPHPALREIGDFRLLREVGHGGMGIVYEAEQVSLGRHVALKVLTRKMMLDARHKRRFEREARAAARLHHTNIVPVFGVGEADGVPYYVMQFIQGQGLDKVIEELQRLQGAAPAGADLSSTSTAPRKELSAEAVARSLLTGGFTTGTDSVNVPAAVPPPDTMAGTPSIADVTTGLSDSVSLSSSVTLLDPARVGRRPSGRRLTYWQSVAGIGVQVAQALDYAHRQGILHRDIKPSNLLLETRGTVWVADFGLAKAQDEQQLTQTGDIMGTLRYMPPEAFEGRSDARGDVYALGVTLYELLVLRPAFGDRDRHQLIKQVTTAEPVRLRRLNRAVPRDLETIVHKAIDRDPARRYQTAHDMAEDLERFIADEPIRARRVSSAEHVVRWARHNKLLAGMLTLLALLLLAVFTGASISAVYFRDLAEKNQDLADNMSKLAEEKGALEEMEKGLRIQEAKARHEAEDNLYHSLVSEVAALRVARQAGFKDNAWTLLQKALAIDTSARDLDALRREAVSCLGDFAGRTPITVTEPGQASGPLAVDPAGKYLIVGLNDGTLRVRAVSGGKECAKLVGHKNPIVAVELSPDGKRLVSADSFGSLIVWKADPEHFWSSVRTLDGIRTPTPRRHCVALLPDGERLAASYFGAPEVSVRSLATGAEVLKLRPKTGGINCWSLSVTPDGRRLAATQLYHVLVWDLKTGTLEQYLKPPLAPAFNVGFSPDGSYLVCGTDQGIVTYEVAGFRQWSLVKLDNVEALAYSPDSQYLAFATSSSVIKLWSLSAQREVAAFPHPGRDRFSTLVFSKDGRWLVSGGTTNVRLWQVGGLSEKMILPGHGQSVPCVAFSPDGKLLASGSKDGTVVLWDTATGQAVHTFPKVGMAQTVAFSPDGSLLAVASYSTGKHFFIFDVASRKLIATPVTHFVEAMAARFSPDGKYLAATGDGLVIWQVITHDQEGTKKDTPEFREVARVAGHRSLNLAIDPASKWIVWVDTDFRLRLWDLHQGKQVPFFGPELLHGWHNLSIHPDGRHVLFVGKGGKVEAWDLTTRQRAYNFVETARMQTSISSLSPDGRWFVAGIASTNATLCDIETRRPFFTLGEERAPIWCYAWTADNQRLAVGLSDGGLAIWDLAAVRAELEQIGLGW